MSAAKPYFPIRLKRQDLLPPARDAHDTLTVRLRRACVQAAGAGLRVVAYTRVLASVSATALPPLRLEFGAIRPRTRLVFFPTNPRCTGWQRGQLYRHAIVAARVELADRRPINEPHPHVAVRAQRGHKAVPHSHLGRSWDLDVPLANTLLLGSVSVHSVFRSCSAVFPSEPRLSFRSPLPLREHSYAHTPPLTRSRAHTCPSVSSTAYEFHPVAISCAGVLSQTLVGLPGIARSRSHSHTPPWSSMAMRRALTSHTPTSGG